MADETAGEAAEVASESVTDTEEVAGKSVAAEIIAEAEAAVANLKYVKRSLRQADELTEIDKDELADAMEEIAAQYSKIQVLYRSAKERLVKVARVLGACLVVAAALAGFVKFFL